MLDVNGIMFAIKYFAIWIISIPPETWIKVVVTGFVLSIVAYLLRHAVKFVMIIGVAMAIITSVISVL